MTNASGPDVSFYQDNPDTLRQIDFTKLKSVSDFVIVRAGQNEWPDPDFAYNWYQSRQAGLPRGSYWYYDSRVHPKRQAELWVKIHNGDLGELPLFADFEEEYGGPYTGWVYFKEFLEEVKRLAPEKVVGIYTAFYYWRDYVKLPLSEYAYFAQYILWIANYGVAIPSVPAPWTNWLFHQYTSSGPGADYGVESSDIDLNVFNGSKELFSSIFGSSTPVPEPSRPEIHLEVYPGVMYHEIFRHGSWCYAFVIKPGRAVYKVTKFGQKRVSSVQEETGAQIVVNGGAYNSSGAIGLHVTEGIHRSSQDEYEPFANSDKDNNFNILYWKSYLQAYNALAGKRMIVEDGKVSPNTSVAWRELHPRTLVGAQADGSSVWCVVDGRQPGYSIGVDLYDGADIMIELGCVRATDEDGGGSSTLNHNGRTCNIPIDGNIPGQERYVGTHNVIYINDEGTTPPSTGEKMATKGTAIRITNLKPTDGSPTMAQLPVGGYIYGDAATTDLLGFNHYYLEDGTRKELIKNGEHVTCKATLSNLRLTFNVVEPGTENPTDPTLPIPKHTIKVFPNGSVQVDDGPVIP